jgi:thiol-disulfide isomerase/thioredoxin
VSQQPDPKAVPVTVGAVAPTFRLPASDGDPRSLGDLLVDGPALLVFLKTTCPTSAVAMPVYGELARRYGDLVPVVAVSQDPMLVAVPWLTGHDFGGVALDDTSDRFAVSAAFGISTVPTAVLVDEAGVVADVVAGWDREAMNRLATTLAALTRRGGDPVSTPEDGRPPQKPG